MKTNFLKKIIMLMVVITFGIYQVQSQTNGAGSINTNNGVGTSGTYRTFIGDYAGNSNSGTYNSFFGDHAGYTNTTGTYNTFSGGLSGYSNSTGAQNTFLGFEAGYSSTTNYNTFFGYCSGTNTTSGNYNTFLGHTSGSSNSTGAYNTFIGLQSANKNTTGSYNVTLGLNASYYNKTGGYNTVLGAYAGQGANNNSYSNNCFIGYNTGYSATTGGYNTALGYQALYSNTIGVTNTAIGAEALYSNTAEGNTATGYQALYSNTSAGGNTAHGYMALTNNTGTSNTAVGAGALGSNTTGTYNTAFGKSAGFTYTTGDHNTFLGYAADMAANNYTNATVIGSGATNNQGPNTMYLGNSTCNQIWVGAGGNYNVSDGRFKINVTENVKGLEFINKLRPVTYNMDTKALDGFINNGRNKTVIVPHTQTQTFTDSTGTHTTTITTYDTIVSINPNANLDFGPSTAIVHSGFIAQEVVQAANSCGFISTIVSVPTDPSKSNYGLNYAEIVVPLVKAVQELSKEVDSLKTALKNNGAVNKTIDNTGSNNSGKNIQDIKLILPDIATLGDAQPNPNNGSTQISYFLPDNVSNAKIIFTDMLGKVIQQKLLESGYGVLNIDTQDLPTGIYFYSLVVDDKVIDNKKMVRNK